MKNSSAAIDYARVFYQVCKEENIVDEILYDANSMIKIHDKEINRMLSVPVISRELKRQILDSLVEINMKQEVINLIKILVDNHQTEIFGQIISEFKKLYQVDTGIQIVHITMAKEMDSQTLNHMREGLEKKLNKYIVFSTIIDPNVIGGIKFEYDGYVVDNTVERQLKVMEKTFRK